MPSPQLRLRPGNLLMGDACIVDISLNGDNWAWVFSVCSSGIVRNHSLGHVLLSWGAPIALLDRFGIDPDGPVRIVEHDLPPINSDTRRPTSLRFSLEPDYYGGVVLRSLILDPGHPSYASDNYAWKLVRWSPSDSGGSDATGLECVAGNPESLPLPLTSCGRLPLAN